MTDIVEKLKEIDTLPINRNVEEVSRELSVWLRKNYALRKEAAAEIAALREANAWCDDMSKAPKDGSDVLVAVNGRTIIASWFDHWEYDQYRKPGPGWVAPGGRVVDPTAWRALPQPDMRKEDDNI